MGSKRIPINDFVCYICRFKSKDPVKFYKVAIAEAGNTRRQSKYYICKKCMHDKYVSKETLNRHFDINSVGNNSNTLLNDH